LGSIERAYGRGKDVLTFGQLQTLQAISETGSFSKAARRLYLSQPAVSQRIRALEDTLGVEVFDRDNGGTQLTPTAEGEEVLKFAAATLEGYEALLKRLADAAARDAVVTIGTVGFYAGTFVLPRILPLIHAAHPEIQIRMVNLPVQRLIESARSGAVDLVLVAKERVEAGLDSQPLWEDELIMVTHPSRANELARQPRLIPLILTGVPEQLSFARRWCADLGVPSQTVVESSSSDTLKNAALANLGYALLPEIVVRAELEAGTLVRVTVPGLPLRRVVVAAYLPERATAPAVAKFLSALHSARRQLRGINPQAPALEPRTLPQAKPVFRDAIAGI
jgi:molybdate transport repressor ModE-like protein